MPGEAGVVLPLGLRLLSNSVALSVSDVVAVSGFLSQVDVPLILAVWLIDMVLVILATGFHSLVVDRFDRVTLARAMIIGFALSYVGLRLMFVFDAPGWLNYSLLYLLAEQQWLFFPLVFWILANDVFDLAQAKRLFPVVATFGLVGQVIGLGIASIAPTVLGWVGVSSAELLTLNVAVYVLALVLIARRLSNLKVRPTIQQRETVRETLTEGWSFVREVPSFRYLMLAIVAGSLALTAIEFRFLVVADRTFTDLDSFQTFYGIYLVGLTLAAIAVQGFLTSRLIEKINLKNVFFFIPLVLLAGALLMIGFPGIIGVTLGIALPYLTKDTVDDSAQKAFKALVPEERRGRVSLFMESYLYAVGTILGCIMTGAIVLLAGRLEIENEFRIYLAGAALGALFAIWAVSMMRSSYDSSLFNWRLKRRQHRASVLDRLDF